MVVYKYLHNYGLKFLSNMRLKLTSPAKVDDPFEMRPQPGAELATKEMAQKLLSHPDRLEFFTNLTGSKNVAEFSESLRSDPDQFVNWINKFIIEGLRSYCDQSSRGVAGEYSMLCFSETCKNVLMWSHYGDAHRGIAVGFDRLGLEEFLGARMLNVECIDERVVYNVEQMLFPQRDYVEKLLTRKSTSWLYQQEVRCIIRHEARTFITCPPDIIRGIFLGCNFPDRLIPCVREAAKKNGLSADLMRGQIDERLFRINFIKLT